MNVYSAIGRLTKAPHLTYTDGLAKCEMVIAVEDRIARRTDFIPIVIWRDLAEYCANYLVKGQKIGVTGKLRSHNYQRGGMNLTRYEVEAYEVDFGQAPKRN
ncbi:single-stranded DNA-binding protein [Metabacillus fastidiosus]|uniref:Single-stranded DNA-binding protein n=1 Tax=Metabacillus fastidiosus TaxID=1458 RepID=A0ABU6NUL7_9BACI|nr:single-stranded DNA-binding protein [Metabacillus fastidiosus]MED4400303.1 single-stranded DNA-binding protein [Metabacillus fastidiosus]